MATLLGRYAHHVSGYRFAFSTISSSAYHKITAPIGGQPYVSAECMYVVGTHLRIAALRCVVLLVLPPLFITFFSIAFSASGQNKNCREWPNISENVDVDVDEGGRF